MQIRKIIAHAGRTFNHPHEDYSNLRPGITLEAELGDGEDAVACAKALQHQAEQLAEDQKRNLLAAMEDEYQVGQAKTRMIGLARQLKSAQDELDTLRQQWPELKQLTLTEGV